MDLTTIPEESEAGDDLFARARGGDQAAWKALFDECYPKVQRAVRKRLKGPLRQYVDSTDIASDVLGDLAKNASRYQFDSVADVRKFLFAAAHQRVIDEDRRHLAKKRDRGLERPMRDAFGGDVWGISSGEPTPSQVAVAHETDERLLATAEDATSRRVIALRSQSYDNKEIAEQTGWSLRRVQRYLEKLRISLLN